MCVARVEHRGEVRHVFTHRDVTADVYRVEGTSQITGGGQSALDHPGRTWRPGRVKLHAEDLEKGDSHGLRS